MCTENDLVKKYMSKSYDPAMNSSPSAGLLLNQTPTAYMTSKSHNPLFNSDDRTSRQSSEIHMNPADPSQAHNLHNTNESFNDNEPKAAAYSYLKYYFVSMLQPSDNKLAMKLFGSKKGVLKEKLRQQNVGHWIIHPCSNFR